MHSVYSKRDLGRGFMVLEVQEIKLSKSLILLLAIGAGVSVSSLYYAQPMLSTIRDDLNISMEHAGLIPSMTQIGYALGLFFLAPLGDRFNRKKIINIKLLLLMSALLMSFYAPAIGWMLVASFFIGLVSTAAQDYVPAAAILSKDHERGKNVGMVMTGLLLGILLSRVLSGSISEQFGWRVVYLFGAGLMMGLLLLTKKFMPDFSPTTNESYKNLIISMFELVRKHPAVKSVTLSQALLAVAFSAFWSTLSLILFERYQMGPMSAGAFGLAGAAGTMAAPIAGRLSDKYGAAIISKVGSTIACLSFALLFFLDFFSMSTQIILLVICAIGFDFGIQASLISHQSIIYGLDPMARSRLNALLMTGMFIGMSVGASLGSIFFANFGLIGFASLTTLSTFVVVLLKTLKK